MDRKPANDFLKSSPFTLIGLILAAATVVFFCIGFIPGLPNLSTIGIFTLLGGGLFLLIGGNDQISEQNY